MTDMTDMTDITYVTYITYITYITDSKDSTDSTYMTYIQDIHDIHYRHIAFPEVSIHDTTRHDMTLLHILTYGSCAHGKGKGTEEKKSRVVHIHAARGR